MAALFAGVSLAQAQTPAQPLDPENTLVLTLKDGKVTIRLRPDLAPKHVAQIKTLVRRGFYDGIVFHRVIPGFMAQTGDPRGDGTGGSDLPNIPAEFNPQPFPARHVGHGALQLPDSANSQFFICFDAAPHLTGNYTAFGQSCPAWSSSTRSRRATAPTARSADLTRSSPCACSRTSSKERKPA